MTVWLSGYRGKIPMLYDTMFSGQ